MVIFRIYRSYWVAILSAVLAGLSFLPSHLSAWDYQGDHFRRLEIFPGGAPLKMVQAADLDGDGVLERLRLASGRVEIIKDENTVWTSPAGWQVKSALLADLDHDQQVEVSLLVWRAFQPFPIDRTLPSPGLIDHFHDQSGRSCHLIMIWWQRGSFRERWAGSALARPVQWLAAVDLQGDGGQELLTLEGEYDDPSGDHNGPLGLWEWNGFGFSRLARSESVFRRVQVYTAPNQAPWLLVQE